MKSYVVTIGGLALEIQGSNPEIAVIKAVRILSISARDGAFCVSWNWIPKHRRKLTEAEKISRRIGRDQKRLTEIDAHA